MLTALEIKNFALIDELNVKFNNGLSIITGETGAGKSILLGGLSLVLGKRADLSQVKNSDQKCVIEAVFDIANYDLKHLFHKLDLDYDVQTIIRREILPSGKSRAFVNDTPTTLDSLVALSSSLIDIHSQHQTQQLMHDNYQFIVIDALAKNKDNLNIFSQKLTAYRTLFKSLERLKASKAEMVKDYDYNIFLHKELSEVNLEDVDLEELESQFEQLNNIEFIGEKIDSARAILEREELGVIDQINSIKQELSKVENFGDSFQQLNERVLSVNIELQDILSELDNIEEGLSSDPQELQRISSKLQIINNLLQKHAVTEITDLIEIKNKLDSKVSSTENLDDIILEKEQELSVLKNELNELSIRIHEKRKSAAPKLISKLESKLLDLGMPNAKFQIDLRMIDDFKSNGKDDLLFLFTANKGSKFSELKKSASGGELSRIMLVIKSIMSDYIHLPSIMFDEIDTGVSGEISNKMGDIMKQMSQRMQVFSITHLPQIAAKGDSHFKVYKTDINNRTHTRLKRLDEEGRIVEIAEMLGGTNITESAMAHAKQLLN